MSHMEAENTNWIGKKKNSQKLLKIELDGGMVTFIPLDRM